MTEFCIKFSILFYLYNVLVLISCEHVMILFIFQTVNGCAKQQVTLVKIGDGPTAMCCERCRRRTAAYLLALALGLPGVLEGMSTVLPSVRSISLSNLLATATATNTRTCFLIRSLPNFRRLTKKFTTRTAWRLPSRH